MSTVANLVGYQVLWFIAVAGAGRGVAWPAFAAMLLFVGVQLALSRRRGAELKVIAVAVLIGACLDGALATSGLVSYATPAPALPPGGAPGWILAIWAAFATTLTRSLAWLEGRWLPAALLGGLGGPLAYLAAARGFGAVTFSTPLWRPALALGAAWAAALVLLVRVAGLRTATVATP